MRAARLPPPLRFPGDVEQALAFGRVMVPHSSSLRLPFPGAFVWRDVGGDMDHALVRSRWLPMHLAWAAGSEPTVPLSEVPRWAPFPGLDDASPPRWAPFPPSP